MVTKILTDSFLSWQYIKKWPQPVPKQRYLLLGSGIMNLVHVICLHWPFRSLIVYKFLKILVSHIFMTLFWNWFTVVMFFLPSKDTFLPINFWVVLFEPGISQNNLLFFQSGYKKIVRLSVSIDCQIWPGVFCDCSSFVWSSIHIENFDGMFQVLCLDFLVWTKF